MGTPEGAPHQEGAPAWRTSDSKNTGREWADSPAFTGV